MNKKIRTIDLTNSNVVLGSGPNALATIHGLLESNKEILTNKIDDLHKIAKALMTYETLTGEEIENIINKNIYPTDKQNLKADDDKGSAMDVMGLKPKIVH